MKLPNKQRQRRFLTAAQCDGALNDGGINAHKSWIESNGLQTQKLLEITQGVISHLFNTHRYHNKHWSYSLPLHQPTLTGYLSNNTKDVKLIQHHQYKNMYHTSNTTSRNNSFSFYCTQYNMFRRIFSPSPGR